VIDEVYVSDYLFNSDSERGAGAVRSNSKKLKPKQNIKKQKEKFLHTLWET